MRLIPGRPTHLLLVTFLLTAACGDDPLESVPVPEGQMSATISGAITDQYEVTGRYPGGSSGEPETFAAARFNSFNGSFAVGGWRAREPDIQDALLIEFRDATEPGTYAISGGLLNYGSTDSGSGRTFEVTAGQVTLVAFSQDRVHGTFQATGIDALASPLDPAPDTVYITDGTFSVPVVDF